jgi:predicted PurR-regulated permease PerM
MFLALLFLPLMRQLSRWNIPKIISIIIVLVLVGFTLFVAVELIQLSTRQILSADTDFFSKAEQKMGNLTAYLKDNFGFTIPENERMMSNLFKQENLGSTFQFLRKFLTTILMTGFFMVLWLAESINVHKLLNNTLLKQKYTSVKTFMKIEKDLIKFIKVKFFVSALTGLFTGLMCVFFDVSFPIFWGLFAFAINFVQMVGSFISVVLLSLFAFVELDTSTTLLLFILSITAVQVVCGAILEPVFMGKSFSINIIAVLVMLMFWGFLWGIPGLIMAIPITVFVKIILEQFPSTKVLASLLSMKETKFD